MVRPVAFLLPFCFAASACMTTPETLPFEVMSVPSVAETDGMPARGDRADDPAIWLNPAQSERSLILGTNKETGLYVYDLNGGTLQVLPVGRLNNIDLRGNIAVGSNDEVNGLSWFEIDPETTIVTHLGDTAVTPVEPYGVCAGKMDGAFMASPTYKDGKMEIWAADTIGDGRLEPTLKRTVQFPGQLEGCVYHEASRRLFIGEEERGIWVLDLTDDNAEPALFDTIAASNGLVMDVEGLSIWDRGTGSAYLVASAQAKDRFVVYDLNTNVPVGIFTVVQNTDAGIDAVTHTDGLDITAAALPGYPRGLLVVQDDGNPNPEQAQNFKLVDWASIEDALGLRE
jgi:3-phytase